LAILTVGKDWIPFNDFHISTTGNQNRNCIAVPILDIVFKQQWGWTLDRFDKH